MTVFSFNCYLNNLYLIYNYQSSNFFVCKMSRRLELVGFVSQLCTVSVCSEIKDKFKLRKVEVIFKANDPDVLVLEGSPNQFKETLKYLAVEDLIVVSQFYYLNPENNRKVAQEITAIDIRRIMREGKEQRYYDLPVKGYPECPRFGRRPWVFITPRTKRKHDLPMKSQILKCLSCEVKRDCTDITLIRVLEKMCVPEYKND